VERTAAGRLLKELAGRALLTRFPVASCDVCGGRDFRPVHRRALRTVVACRGCGLEFARHIPPGGFDAHFAIFDVGASFANTYLAHGCRLDEPAWVGSRMALLDRLLAEDGFEGHSGGGRAYEIGCGDGALLALLARRGWEVRGGDAGAQCLSRARALGLTVERRLAAELRQVTERFDLVVAFHLLEHVDSPRALLADCASLLAPEGRLLFEVPLRPTDPVRRRGALHGYGIYGHMFYFRPEDIHALLARAGLRLVREDLREESGSELMTFTAALAGD